jgi:hypothetical protein
MDQRSVRVVVGREDASATRIRAALEDQGFHIAAEASTVEDLARLVQADPPDVIVLDDTLGVVAVQAVVELAPAAKLVLIWPAAVLPIAGATRIDADDLHSSLAPAVAAAAGVVLTGFTTIDRPDWIDGVRKDPATLRGKLAANGGVPARPSITELQRPHGYPAPTTGWRRRSSRPAVPVAAAAAASTSAAAEEDATVNRRLGMIALGGAVAAGALMIALSFGRAAPNGVVTAEPFVPGISAPSNFVPNPAGDPTQAGTGNGNHTGTGSGTTTDGTNGTAVAPTSGTGSATGTNDGTGTPTGSGGGSTTGSGAPGGGSTGEPLAGNHHQSASGPGANPGGGAQGGGGTPGGGGGTPGGGGGGQGSGSHGSTTPGHSGDHNPHGGPPGQTGDRPGNGGQHAADPPQHTQRQVHRHKG